MTRVANDTLRATKQFIFDVRPMILDDLGLTPTLRRYLVDLQERSGFRLTVEESGASFRLPADVESSLFRFLQLATEAVRHAGAGGADLHLDWLEDRVLVSLAPAGPLENETGRRLRAELRNVVDGRRTGPWDRLAPTLAGEAPPKVLAVAPRGSTASP